MSRAIAFILACFVASPMAAAQWVDPPPASAAAAPPGWLGVTLASEASGQGERVEQTLPGSPALAAGLQPGDLLLQVGDAPTTTVDAFVQSVQARAAGEAISLLVQRREETLRVDVVLGPRPRNLGDVTRLLEGERVPMLAVTEARSGLATPLLAPQASMHLVEFWATWCGPCAIVRPQMVALHETYAEAGLDIVGVSGEERAEVAAYLEEHALPYRVAVDLDGQLQSQLFAMVLPTWFLVDDEGTILRIASGLGGITAIEEAIAAHFAAER